MSLPNEVRAKYVEIIDDILAKSDLTAVTEKRIRNGIQGRVEYDITPQKAAIKQLIMERFDIFNARQNGDTEPTSASKTNGHTKSRSRSASETGQKREAEDSESSSDVVDDAPPKKKRKENKDTAKETDAEIAARLQAQEDRAARPTRGAAPRKAAPAKKKKTPKKKTATRITGSDDSDIEEGGTERKVNRETGFHKPMNLSAQAADFFGVSQLSRPQVTKQVWAYIKDKQLQDQSDKRYILCDDKLRALLKQDKVHMFQMTKILSGHMYNPEE